MFLHNVLLLIVIRVQVELNDTISSINAYKHLFFYCSNKRLCSFLPIILCWKNPIFTWDPRDGRSWLRFYLEGPVSASCTLSREHPKASRGKHLCNYMWSLCKKSMLYYYVSVIFVCFCMVGNRPNGISSHITKKFWNFCLLFTLKAVDSFAITSAGPLK